MKRLIAVLFATAAGALVPWTGAATATGDTTPGAIDIVYVVAAGSVSATLDVNVYGTLFCSATGPVQLDVLLDQETTGGVGQGGNEGQTCRAGRTIKWVQTAHSVDMMIGDPVTVTVFAAISATPAATATERHLLNWGLPAGGND